jgi:hypothetical protein
MCGAIPPLFQDVFMAWCLVKHRDKFTWMYVCMYVCMYACIYVHTYVRTHTYIRPIARPLLTQDNTTQENMGIHHAFGGIRTHDDRVGAVQVHTRLRLSGHWDRQTICNTDSFILHVKQLSRLLLAWSRSQYFPAPIAGLRLDCVHAFPPKQKQAIADR